MGNHRIVFLALLSFVATGAFGAAAVSCAPGQDCSSRFCNASALIDCGPGYFCPGYAAPRRCRKGFYCPKAAEGETPQELVCPAGYFCPEGYADPISCPSTFICPEGSSRYFFFGGVIVFIVGGLVMYSLSLFFNYLDAKKRHAAMHNSYQKLPTVDPSLAGRTYSIAAEKMKSFTMDIGIDNIGLKIGRKRILSGITGEFKAGQVHAIIGPAQSGKTTIMNVLASKLKPTEGKIYVNGKPQSLSAYKNLIAFVPQDDIMIRTLTVQETLTFAALARLPPSWSKDKKLAQVDWAVDVLGLTKVKDSIIGDEERRGVSGGERKRVNIGMELVADPTVLFLDGPTSGLDSTTAADLISLLQRICATGINVITVLYQPRIEIFQMLNDVMLLEKGRTVYFGRSEGAIPYFEMLGYSRPEYTNPADFLLDILSGRVQVNKPGTESDLAETWNTKRPTLALPDPSSYPHASEGKKGFLCFGPRKNSEVHRSSPSFFYQLWVFLQRAFLQQRHDFSGVILDSFLHAIAGLVYGIGFASSRFFVPPIPTQYLPYCTPLIDAFCYLPEVDELGRLATFGTMAVGLTAVTMAVRTFSNEKVVYWREAASGENTFSYFLAKCIADIPNMAIGSVVLLSVFFMIAAPHGKFGDYFGAVFLLEFAVYGVGYVCSMIIPTNKDLATLFAATCALIAGLGVNPGGGRELCWGRWFGEAVYIAELRLDVLDPVTRDAVNSFLDFVKRETPSGTYSLDMFGRDLFALAIFGVVLRFLAYLGLRLIYRGRQK